MRTILLGCCFLYLLTMRAECKPQITKLYPVPEEPGEYQQREETRQELPNEVRPLDKLLGKLKATYNFVFRKPEDTGNVDRILAEDAPNPDTEPLKLIWSAENPTTTGRPNAREDKTLTISADNWIQSIPPPDTPKPLEPAEPLEPLEIEDEDKKQQVEMVNPSTGLQLPAAVSRQLVDWLGSLLGLTYSVYSKLARAVHVKN